MKFTHAAILVAALSGWSALALAQEAAPQAQPAASSAAPEEPALSPEVAKGKYLATAANCISCHTMEDGGTPFTGGRAFVTPFGTMYSTNITQDRETGIGGWSLEDFTQAMRKGVRPDGTHLYPAFPYTSFAKMKDEDIAAIYAYMKTIAPVKAPARANAMKFPFGIRPLMTVWNTLYLKEGVFADTAGKPADWNRGAYLVEVLGHCSACHTPRGMLGGEKPELALTGGVYQDEVRKGVFRAWSAPNLTPAKSGLASWTPEEMTAYFKTGVSSRATVFGPMNEVVMNSTRHMTDADIAAMVAYIKSLPENAQEPGAPAPQDLLALGETVYTLNCGTCHLPSGKGGPPSTIEPGSFGVPIEHSAVVQAPDPASLINTILYGAKRPPNVDSGRIAMKAFGVEMTDKNVAAVASYVRQAWGNVGGGVTEEQVAKQR